MADTRPVVAIHPGQLVKRLQAFYKAWREDENGLWNGAHAVAVIAGSRRYESLVGASLALHLWLSGFEPVEDVAAVFIFTQTQAKRKFHVLCNRAHAEHWRPLSGVIQNDAQVEFALHVREDNRDSAMSMQPPTEVMWIMQEVESELISTMQEGPNEGRRVTSERKRVDLVPALSELLKVKDEEELENVKKAARFCVDVMEEFVFYELVDKTSRNAPAVTHADLREATEMSILYPSLLPMSTRQNNVMEIPYPPVFQSGHQFDLGPNAMSDAQSIIQDAPAGVILCSVTVSHLHYCSSIDRTYFLCPTAKQLDNYRVLLSAHKAAISALKPGVRMYEAYRAAHRVISRAKPELVGHMIGSAGWGMGLARMEFGSTLDAGNGHLVKAGMVFHVRLGLEKLAISDPVSEVPEAREMYSLMVGDTIIVNNDEADGPEIATTGCLKAAASVTLYFNDSDGELEVKDNERGGSGVSEMESESDGWPVLTTTRVGVELENSGDNSAHLEEMTVESVVAVRVEVELATD